MMCPFCEKDVKKFHPNSHVVPKWLFKLTYGKQGKHLSVNLEQEDVRISQDGPKKSFICWECESDFGADDHYASKVFGPKNPRSTIPNMADARETLTQDNEWTTQVRKCLILDGVDFKRLQRFVLGVVMRGYMAKTEDGKGLLGEKHFFRMKKIYRDALNLDDKIYPIFILKVNPDDIFSEFVHLPSRGKGPAGTNLASFVAGGYKFHVGVQSHPISEPFLRLRLNAEGELPVPIVGMLNLLGAVKTFKAVSELSRKRIPWGKQT